MQATFTKHIEHHEIAQKVISGKIDVHEANEMDKRFCLLGKFYLIDGGINVLVTMIEEFFYPNHTPGDRLFNCKGSVIKDLKDIQRTLVRMLEAASLIRDDVDNFILDTLWLETRIKNMTRYITSEPKPVAKGQVTTNRWISEIARRSRVCEQAYWTCVQEELPYSCNDDPHHMGGYLALLPEYFFILSRFLTEA